MTVELTLATPESHIGENSKICYATKALEDGGKDITSTIVHNYKHLSALRFAYATVHIEGISIACQNQFVRSSHMDFMVQSKRYVNPDKGEFSFVYPEGITPYQRMLLKDIWERSMQTYKDLLDDGMKKEDARAILPMNTSTKMNATANLQGWISFFNLRLPDKAQLEIRTLANKIYDLLAVEYPQVFTEEFRQQLKEGH